MASIPTIQPRTLTSPRACLIHDLLQDRVESLAQFRCSAPPLSLHRCSTLANTKSCSRKRLCDTAIPVQVPIDVDEVASYLHPNGKRAWRLVTTHSIPVTLRRLIPLHHSRIVEDIELRRRQADANIHLRQPVRHRTVKTFPSVLTSSVAVTIFFHASVHERVQR